MNFWSVIAVVVVVLKIVGVITLGWVPVVGITAALLCAPYIIAAALWMVAVILAGLVFAGAWCLDKVFGKQRRAKPSKLMNELRRSVASEHRSTRRKYR